MAVSDFLLLVVGSGAVMSDVLLVCCNTIGMLLMVVVVGIGMGRRWLS